jgi:two-component system, chemotaxis family, chemotaxis protein CheY
MSSEPLILVVDDISTFRELIKDMLQEIGFNNVVEASDGQEALDFLKLNQTALVISDYMMSPKSGLDLLKGMKLEPSLNKIPFVLVSAVSDEAIVNEAIELGAQKCLKKPVSFATLKKEVISIFLSRME